MISDSTTYFKKIIFNKSFYLGIFLSSLLLFFSFKNFDSIKFLDAIENVNVISLLLASLLLMIVIYLRAIRWKYLIQDNEISHNNLYRGQLIGYFINNIFPLRIGEIAKSYYIGNKYNLSKSVIFGTVVLERIFDFIGLIFLLLLLCNSNFIFDITDKFFYSLITIVVLSLLGILFLYIFKTQVFKNFVRKKINSLFLNIIEGYSNLKIRSFIPVISLTIFIWIIYILEVFLVQSAFDLGLSINQTIFILFISSIAMILPAVPGNFGTFEGSVIGVLSIFGITDNFGFSFMLHLVSFIPYTIFGFIYCMQGIKFLLIKK